MKNFFIFCAGKSEELALHSKTSPINLTMLALSPIGVKIKYSHQQFN